MKQRVSVTRVWPVLGLVAVLLVGCARASAMVGDAPDVVLEQCGGGTFALLDQLAKGPVVLVILPPGG